MRRAIRVIAILISVVIVSVVIWQRLLDPDAPVKKLTKRIGREVPAGSTKSRVYEFLESERFGFSGYDVGPDPLVGLPEARRERKRYIIAWKPVSGVMPYFGDYDMRIVFYFNEEELVSAYKLQQLYDGP
jgi:hypothetical protein